MYRKYLLQFSTNSHNPVSTVVQQFLFLLQLQSTNKRGMMDSLWIFTCFFLHNFKKSIEILLTWDITSISDNASYYYNYSTTTIKHLSPLQINPYAPSPFWSPLPSNCLTWPPTLWFDRPWCTWKLEFMTHFKLFAENLIPHLVKQKICPC